VGEAKYVECGIQNIGKRLLEGLLEIFLISRVKRRVNVLVFVRGELLQESGFERILTSNVGGRI
jgi:hypothetical protein